MQKQVKPATAAKKSTPAAKKKPAPKKPIPQPALTKAHLSAMLSKQFPFKKNDAKAMIDEFFALMAADLMAGNDVKISGFGSFQIRTKAPRPGRNPRTGTAIPINARRVVTFHASHKLKDQIKDTP